MAARHDHQKHGHTSRTSMTPEYRAWQSMKARCLGPTHADRANYGGRGITVCAEWRTDFLAFFAHVGPRPSAKHSLDRIDNSKGYAPGNVRWATAKEQAANRRRQTHCKRGHAFDVANTVIKSNGERYCRACSNAWQRARTARAGRRP